MNSPRTSKRRKRLADSVYSFVETVSVVLSSPEGPGWLMRLFFKLPVWLHRIGLGRWMGDHLVMLTTTGRKTGRARTTALTNFGHDEETGVYYIGSGWGARSDWYRNLKANHRVHVKVGRHQFNGVAEQVPEELAIRLLSDYLRRYPSVAKIWAKRVGGSFDGSEASLRQLAARTPVVALRPGGHGH